VDLLDDDQPWGWWPCAPENHNKGVRSIELTERIAEITQRPIATGETSAISGAPADR